MRLPEIEVRRGTEALHDLEAEWRALARASGAVPFLSWEWADAWLRHLEPGLVPHLVCAREGGALVGLLALAETKRRIPGFGDITRLGFLGERKGGADYLDVLAAPESHGRATRAILGHLARSTGYELLELDGMAEDSPTRDAIHVAFRRHPRFTTRQAERYTCPRISLDGGFERVLSRSSRADNYRRRVRKARAMTGFEFRAVRDEAEAGAAFERFLVLHEKRWAAQGGSDALGRPATRRFHREVVASLARAGMLRFDELWIDGGCRASIYGIDTPETFYFFQSGYDPEWSSKSVGLVVLGLSIEAAAERGARTYDFLHGTEAYKLEWATGSRRTVTLRLARAGWGAAALLARDAAEAMARGAARAILPAGAVELLRRRRRAREQAGLA